MDVSEATIKDLAAVAGLAPSCSNKQPWRFVFVHSRGMLDRMFATLAPGNATWAKQASLVVAVWSKADLDCKTVARDRGLVHNAIRSCRLTFELVSSRLRVRSRRVCGRYGTASRPHQ